jgi:hypothetical protein
MDDEFGIDASRILQKVDESRGGASCLHGTER